MIFEYSAIDAKGKNITDIIDAPNPLRAREKLRSQGLYVTKISPRSSTTAALAASKPNEGFFGNIISNISDTLSKRSSAKQVGLFSRQLATLIGAGMPLLRAITDILEQTDHQHFKHIVADVKEHLEGGQSLSQSLARHGGVFSEMYINMVRVGENLGSLDTVIERLAEIEEKRNILKSKIQAALLYPAFMITLSIGVIIFLMVKIIPSLSGMFLEVGKELPLPTRIVMGMSSILSSYWYLILIALLALFLFGRRYFKTPEGKEKFDEWILNAPLISKIYRKRLVLLFTRNLGILLNNNVDIIRSLEIVKKIVGNVIIEKKIDDASTRVREGSPLSKALIKADFLPKLVIGMISAGEASDTLDDMLLKIGTVYDTELDLTISSLTSIIEPLIIVFMGIVVGIIVVSVMLPILEMNLLVQ
ncbi:MAG TPA: type II secretion system F family protein [Spirochaetota bacterium]